MNALHAVLWPIISLPVNVLPATAVLSAGNQGAAVLPAMIWTPIVH